MPLSLKRGSSGAEEEEKRGMRAGSGGPSSREAMLGTRRGMTARARWEPEGKDQAGEGEKMGCSG